jgi:hypothetical protein
MPPETIFMNMVNVDENTFNELLFRVEIFTGKIKKFCEWLGEKKPKRWHDNQDVCIKLNISLRTVQTFHSNGTLPYVQINRKMFYKPEDVNE